MDNKDSSKRERCGIRCRVLILVFLAVLAVLPWIYRSKKDDPRIKPPEGVNFEPYGEIRGKSFWYVSEHGDDKNDGQAPDSPLATIQVAIDRAEPGAVIRLADGEYRQDIRTVRDGKPDSPIVIIGSTGAVVKGRDSDRVVQIAHDHIVLEGFTIDGLFGDPDEMKSYRDKLIYIQSESPLDGVEGVKISRMTIKNAGGECVRLKYFAKHNEISDNSISRCGVRDFGFKKDGKNGEGIYIGTAPEQLDNGKNPTEDPDQSNENWIHGNRIDTQGNECVDIKEGSSKNLVEDNDCTGQKDPESAGLDSRGNSNIFRRNTTYGNKGAGIRLGGDTEDMGIHNLVYENRITDNEGGGIKVMQFPQDNLCNNSFEDNEKDDFVGEYAKESKKQFKDCN